MTDAKKKRDGAPNPSVNSARSREAAARDLCATCRAACPVRTDTRAYVDRISQGRYEEAFEKIREFNPFPSVCGLICHHPCEEHCRRQFVDAPVALRNLKRFAVEQAHEYRRRSRATADVRSAKSVGIVGSGPAGLTVAHDVIKAGFKPVVYEALPRAGGILGCGIPKYRLPDEALDRDLEDIIALGVEIRTGLRVVGAMWPSRPRLGASATGAQSGAAVPHAITLAELQGEHDAVVLAIGLSDSRAVPMTGGDHRDVLLAMPFLRDVALGGKVEVEDHVIVIGGGNVAVDCARTAMRLGAQSVTMVCLENEEEMPAWDWECREALEEGIAIVHRQGPKRVVTDASGPITGLEVRAVTRVFDEAGRFAPTYDDGMLSVVDGQMIIVAIGQKSDFALVEGTAVKLTERGLLVWDRNTMATSVPGIFACGEVVTGPGAAIEAVASGHRAARAVIHYLETGVIAAVADETVVQVGPLPDEVIEKVKRLDRLAMPTLSPEERRRSFAQFELGYDEKAALQEALRCVSCTAGATVDDKKCTACLTCLRVCPFGVPAVDNVATMCSEMCQACGLCAVECPANAISIRRFAPGDIRRRVEKLMREAPKPIALVEFVCAQAASTREELSDRVVAVNGDTIGIIPLPCAARVDEVDMMKPFELGARRVRVRMCAGCRYHNADDRLAKRVSRTKGILDAVGVGGDNLSFEIGPRGNKP